MLVSWVVRCLCFRWVCSGSFLCGMILSLRVVRFSFKFSGS